MEFNNDDGHIFVGKVRPELQYQHLAPVVQILAITSGANAQPPLPAPDILLWLPLVVSLESIHFSTGLLWIVRMLSVQGLLFIVKLKC